MPSHCSKINILLILAKNCWKNKNQNFPIFRYFTWKLEFASNILWMIVVPTDFPNVMEYFSQVMKIGKECSYLFHSWRSGLLPSSSKSRPVDLVEGHSVDASIIKLGQSAFNFLRDLKVDWCQSNLHVMLKLLYFKIIVFYKFYDIFCRRHSSMNNPCYNNLFQCMQHDNFRNL